MNQEITMWILTEEYNDYDQYGAYFVAAWNVKPSIEQLSVYLLHYAHKQHVYGGGGRKYPEDHWYNFFEYVPK